ncbi:MAG: Fe-S-containing hydro-lyase [Spirochaetales bacterium]|uniref:Fe-S-containing hydro-lyase n=1 Tax=Candidatus Thalassospirochaeta sargassi TaxID=3119039 RepID=A0AAJ1MKX5_9SPIO|nr:Fe-S-containing hydro-lyase [Spirochaetales bacterium]
MPTKITIPFDKDQLAKLSAGDEVLITGYIYTARDVAHKRLCELIDTNKELPLDLSDSIIYFAGPSPAAPGRVIGAAGPTTSYRMDAFSPKLIEKAGITGMIGKGSRSEEVIAAMKKNGAVYFAAIGGAGALIAEKVKSAEIVCYEDLGPEAIRRLEVEDFPAVVAIDSTGRNLYETGPAEFVKF